MLFHEYFFNIDPKTYEEHIKGICENYFEADCHMNDVRICNELNAWIAERVIYHDKKIFKQDGQYYKPTNIVMIPQRIKPQFMHLSHVDSSANHNIDIGPMGAVKLLTVMESFTSNHLTNGKTYKINNVSCYLKKRGGLLYLCIDYNNEKLKNSFLDKCHCKMAANVLRTIINNSDFWFYH